MNELFTMGGLPVMPYAVCIAASLLIGIIMLLARAGKHDVSKDHAMVLAALCLPFGLIGARLFYCLSRITMYMEMGLENIFCLWQGGYMLFGAMAGAALAAVVTAKCCKVPCSKLMDALAAPSAVVICLTRLAEYFSGEGIGAYVENEALCFFPLSVMNEWEEWHFAVFLLEAVCALVIMLVLIRKKRAAGEEAKLFLILFCACQVFLEQLRNDNYPRWLFVRVSQLLAVIVMLLMLLFTGIRFIRTKRTYEKRYAVLWAVYLLCAGICVAMEFALDKWANFPNWLCYVLILLSSVGFGLITYHGVIRIPYGIKAKLQDCND